MPALLPPFPASGSEAAGQEGGSLVQAGTRRGLQECQLSAARGDPGGRGCMQKQRGCLGGVGQQQAGHPKPPQPWEMHDMGRAGDPWLLIPVQGSGLSPAPGDSGSSPASQESSLANEQGSALGEDALCPSCPSCATQQKGIRGARGRIQVSCGDSGRGTLESEQGDGNTALLLYSCEIKSPVPSAEPFFFSPLV